MANILVVGPHPDDQELGMGGTIVRLVRQKHNVLLLDMTNGEPTPHGSPEIRARESAEAARIMGVPRRQLGLTNRQVVHNVESRHKVAGVIREHQASIVFLPYFEDARFDAKLTKIDLPGNPIYPKWLIYYYCTHLRTVANPNLLLDISDAWQVKEQAVMAYHSQFIAAGNNKRVTVWLRDHAAYLGSRIGVEYAEGFYFREPLGLSNLDGLVMQTFVSSEEPGRTQGGT